MFRFIIAAVFAILAISPARADYVGNAFGVENIYQVFEFTDGGNPYRPVSGGAHAAWPSSVDIGATRAVYASEFSGGKWGTVKKWVSNSGGAYTSSGVVFTSGALEPNGVGPTVTTYDGSTFRLFYSVRGAVNGRYSIGLAKSADGSSFTRAGTVYFDTVNPLSVSYACTDGATSYLLVHEYTPNMETAKTVLLSASDPDGPYGKVTTIFPHSGISGTLTGSAGNQFAAFTGGLRVGVPVVVNGAAASVYIPREIVGNFAYFDRPLVENYTGAAWGEHFRNKADLSFIRKNGAAWAGALTGYGAFPGVISEFTQPVNAPSAAGPWSLGSGYFLQPYFNSGKTSTENPEPVRVDATCD